MLPSLGPSPQDVVILTGIIIGVEDPADYPCVFVNADSNGDGEISVQDAVSVLECILEGDC